MFMPIPLSLLTMFDILSYSKITQLSIYYNLFIKHIQIELHQSSIICKSVDDSDVYGWTKKAILSIVAH